MKNLPFLLLLLMTFSIPWENTVVLGALGTIVRPLGILAFVITILNVLRTGVYRPFSMFHYALLAFVVWSGISIVWSVDPDLTLIRIKTYAQLFIMVWLIWELVRTNEQMNTLMQVYILGAWVSITNTVMNFANAEEATYGRYSAAGFDPNDLGVMLALGIPIAWYLFIKQRNLILKWSNAAYVVMAMLTIGLTASRTAFVVGIIGLFFVLLTYKQLSSKLKLVVTLFMVVSISYTIQTIPAGAFERIATIQSDMDGGDLNGRSVFWQAGLEMINNSPIAGIGAGAFPAEMESLIDIRAVSHNTFIAVLAETGVIGFVLFLAILGLFLYIACKASRLESLLFLSILLIWIVATLFLTWEMRKPTWFLFGLIALQYAKMYRPTVVYMKNRPNAIEE